MNESKQNQCPACGKDLPAGAAHGLCPACLMAQAMASRTFYTQEASQAPSRLPSPEEIADKFPQFEVVECLGRGGMGIVYKARQKSLDRWVAIKVLAPERVHEERFAEHFEREAKTLAKMSHPNIVTVFDHGQTDGLFYIVMEFIDGVNLRDLLRDGKMNPEQALAIVPPVCEALEYAHGKGVVHRDIKPENLLLDKDGRIKIADFGIASLVGATGEKSGTPPCMAPEQETGNVDRRADIYALGVVLYEMLTGERPAKNIVAPSRKVQVDVKIDEMVLRALEKEPERRYQTAGEFRTVVETMAGAGWCSDVSDKPLPVTSAAGQSVAHSSPSGTGLLVLGVLSFLLGPITAIPGLLLNRRFRPFSPTALVGYALCWLSLVLTILAATLLVLIKPATLSSHTKGNAAQLTQDAWQLWQAGKPAEARPMFEEAVKLAPDDADAWNGLGWSCFNSGDSAAAEQAFEKTLALEPKHPAALNGLGQIALSRRDFESAESYLLKAAEQKATAAWFGLARLYLLQGKFDQAEKWAQMIADAGQADETAKKMLEAAKKKQLPDGLKAMIEPTAARDAGKTSTNPPPSKRQREYHLKATRESAATADKIDDATSWDPWAEHIKNGDMRRMDDDLAGALESYRNSLADAGKTRDVSLRNKRLADSHTRIGDILCQQGDLDGALENYRASVTILADLAKQDPANPDTRKKLIWSRVKLGDVLRAQGDVAGALTSYRGGEDQERFWQHVFSSEPGDYEPTEPFDPEELKRLAANPKERDEFRRLMWLVNRAGAEKDSSFRWLLDKQELRNDEAVDLALAGYDYSVNGNEKALDYLLAKLALEPVGSDSSVVVALSFIDEWERSVKAVEAHFTSTDGAGGFAKRAFWNTRAYLFPRSDLQYDGKAGEGAPITKENREHAPADEASAKVIIEDLALHLIVAIREKDDAKLKSLATDRIKGWPEALPTFAVELRERYRQITGDDKFDLRAGESLIEGELGAVRCTGPAVLEGKCVVMFFVKTPDGWKNQLLRTATEDVPLAELLADFRRQLDKAIRNPNGK